MTVFMTKHVNSFQILLLVFNSLGKKHQNSYIYELGNNIWTPVRAASKTALMGNVSCACGLKIAILGWEKKKS